MFSQCTLCHSNQYNSDKGKEYSEYVYAIDLFLEEDQTSSDRKYRNRSYDHRTDGRRTGKFQTVCLADEINERLKECQKQEFSQVLFLYPLDSCICRIEQEKYESCKEYPDKYEIEYRNILSDKLICPYVGHSPEYYRTHRRYVYERLAWLYFW